MNRNNQHRPVGRPREFNEERVLEAAMDVFWRKGYESSSLAELCSATGLHKGSLYKAFGDKHGLFMRALEYYATMEYCRVLDVISHEATALQNLHAVVKKIIEVSNADKGCLMINSVVELAPHDEEARKALQKYGSERVTALTELISKAQATGELKQSHNARNLALQLILSIAGAVSLAKGLIPQETTSELLKELINSWR